MRSRLVMLVVTLTGISAALVGVALTPATADHSDHGYHWPTTSYPIDLRPINSLSPGFRDQGIPGAVNGDWNRSRKFDNTMRDGSNGSDFRRRCPYPSGKSFRMCNYNWGKTGWAGLAQIHVRDYHTVDGRARINDYYGTSYKYRRHVLCHEYGHVLGLAHQADGNHSCMDDSQRKWDELTPNGHDYDQLLNIYDHRHSSKTAPDATNEEEFAAGSDDDTTVTRLPNGDLLVTIFLRPPGHD